jgi:hypothetical protein
LWRGINFASIVDVNEYLFREFREMPMKIRLRTIVLIVLLGMCVAAQTVAQEVDCPTIVQEALQTTDQVCAATGRNQACYGNSAIEAELRAEFGDAVFGQVGDTVEMAAVRNLQLYPLHVEAETWGVALLRLQANLPDTLPGQNVTFLMFGDVEWESAETDATAEEDEDTLQAYYFRTGVGDAPCEEAPNSGILVQTPHGVGKIQLTLNDVNITLASSAFLQATPGENMHINMTEGISWIEAHGVQQKALGGMRVRVPLDADGLASGPPEPPEMCAEADMTGLPTNWNCDHLQVIIPEQCPIAVPSGIEITLHMGSGYATRAEAQERLAEDFSQIIIDGESVAVERYGSYFDGQYFAYGTNHEWGTPPPGNYSIQGVEQNRTTTCNLTILEAPQ